MSTTKRPLRVIIDTDPGVDDLMALLMLLEHADAEVLGLTSIFGNASTDQCTYNSQRILTAIDREDIAIFPGAQHPLRGQTPEFAPAVHGADGLGGGSTTPEEILRGPMPSVHLETAQEALHRVCASRPGEVTILALGPLTNLALALRDTPDLAFLARDVVIMGGNAVGPGNRTPAGEANILGDPEAADLVLGAGWNLTMVGLDVTNHVTFSNERVESVARADTPAGELLGTALAHYLLFNRSTSGRNEIKLHDPTAAAFLLAPELFEHSNWPVAVDTSTGIGRGKTWPCVGDPNRAGEPWAERRPVRVCTAADSLALADLVHSLLINC